MKAVVSLDEFRKNLSDIVAKVMYADQTFLIQKHNKRGAVIISDREYENLRDPRKRFASKNEWDKLFFLTDKIRNRMTKKNQEKLEEMLDEEISAVRSQNL